jgi:hypothetical protein
MLAIILYDFVQYWMNRSVLGILAVVIVNHTLAYKLTGPIVKSNLKAWQVIDWMFSVKWNDAWLTKTMHGNTIQYSEVIDTTCSSRSHIAVRKYYGPLVSSSSVVL